MTYQQHHLTDISWVSIVKVVIVLVLFYLLYSILDILGLVFVAMVIAAAFGPWVDWLYKRRVPRALSVISIYVVIFLIMALVVYLLIPPLVTQIHQLANVLPSYYSQAISGLSQVQQTTDLEAANTIKDFLKDIGLGLTKAASSIVGMVTGIFGGIVQLTIVLVISFYLIVQEDGLKRFLRSLTPTKYQPYIIQLLGRINIKLGAWFRAQLVLMLAVGILTFIGLQLVGMDYVLILALWAGLTEIIPYVGPIIGAIPAVFLAFTISPWQGLIVTLIYIVVQQLENNILVPSIMRRAVGLNPIISIVVILIGAKWGGIMGAVLSIPLATVLAVILSDVFDDWKTDDSGGLQIW